MKCNKLKIHNIFKNKILFLILPCLSFCTSLTYANGLILVKTNHNVNITGQQINKPQNERYTGVDDYLNNQSFLQLVKTSSNSDIQISSNNTTSLPNAIVLNNSKSSTNGQRNSIPIPDQSNRANGVNLTQQEINYYQNLDALVNQYVLNGNNNNDRVVETNPARAQMQNNFIRPVNYRINSNYGMRNHPIQKVRKMHTGVDFAAPHGTPIKAVQDGVVAFSGSRGGYGNTVVLEHAGNKYSTLYGHTSKLLVSEGQFVRQGQVIALVGSTGQSTGPHLHFEVFENGRRINPIHKL